MVMPGDSVNLTISLGSDVVVEEGMRFALREGGRTVGAGVVSTILPNLTDAEKAELSSAKAKRGQNAK